MLDLGPYAKLFALHSTFSYLLHRPLATDATIERLRVAGREVVQHASACAPRTSTAATHVTAAERHGRLRAAKRPPARGTGCWATKQCPR